MKNLLLVGFLLLFLYTAKAQIKWSTNLGGGITYFENVFSDFPIPNYTGGAMFQGGTSISSLFGRESKVGWEVGLNVVSAGYYSVPSLTDETGLGIGWDYANKESRRDWYIQLPVSLTFNMFEGTGFLLGARMNRRLTNLDKYNDNFRKWIPAAHLGIFTQITPRIRLDATAFMDIPMRYDLAIRDAQGLREVGGSVNIRYTLK